VSSIGEGWLSQAAAMSAATGIGSFVVAMVEDTRAGRLPLASLNVVIPPYEKGNT
jgi:hypothetical protein